MTQHRVCLNMIVREEAETMPHLLDSVRGLVDYYAIVDTGSMDGTQEVIRNHTRGWLEGEIIERPWVNYSANRNEALDLARSTGSRWAFIIDADDELRGEKNPTLEDGLSYYLAKRGSGFEWTLPSIIWLANDWQWKGPVHEVLTSTDARTGYLGDPWILYNARIGCRTRQGDKFLRDAEMLERAVKENPNDSRSWFYLGQSYVNAQVHDKAHAAYERRTHLKAGWDEERCVSHYMIARIKLAYKHPFDDVLHHFLAAHEISPNRAEPLHGIAVLYRVVRENCEAAYPFARLAATKTMDPRFLFAESDVYTFKSLEELVLSAQRTGRQGAGQEACTVLRNRLGKIAEPHRTRVVECLRNAETPNWPWQFTG